MRSTLITPSYSLFMHVQNKLAVHVSDTNFLLWSCLDKMLQTSILGETGFIYITVSDDSFWLLVHSLKQSMVGSCGSGGSSHRGGQETEKRMLGR